MRPLALLVTLICAAPAFAAEPATHWSLRPRTRPAVPDVRDPKFAIRTPVDAFILDRLGKEGLSPAPEADRLTLVRRVTFAGAGISIRSLAKVRSIPSESSHVANRAARVAVLLLRHDWS
jgi:hypothetical protein